MTSNKFTSTKSNPGTPPVCIKPPPPPPSYPSAPPSYPPSSTPDPWHAFVHAHKLPPEPTPPFPDIETRSLAYYIYPNPQAPALWANLDQIKARLALFNGRRIFAIATGSGLIQPQLIVDYLDTPAELIFPPNDPRRREASAFARLLQKLRTLDPRTAIFYAHTKGTGDYHQSNAVRQRGIMFWRNRLYTELLDNWARVHAHLKTYPTVGAFKIDYRGQAGKPRYTPTGAQSPVWHFSGAFYWFRAACAYSLPEWSSIPDDPYASEIWPGRLWNTRQAATVYQPASPTRHPFPNPYDPETHANPIADP